MDFWSRSPRKTRRAGDRNDNTSVSMKVGNNIREVNENKTGLRWFGYVKEKT
jgi:hypothetical protein